MTTVLSPASATRIERPPAQAAPTGPASPGTPRLDAPLPDVRLPLCFMLTGMVSLATAAIVLATRPDLLATYHYNQHIIAVTHLVVLGFLLSVVSGALYQLVPVVLETRLHSERLARAHYAIHLVSVAGMVWMFWTWNMKQVGHFGSGLAAGVGLLVWNLGRTLIRARRWNPVSFGVASALAWLTSTIVAGLALAAAKSTYELTGRTDVQPALAATLAGLEATQRFLAHFEPMAVMHAHAHLGVLGVFILLTCSVAFRLVPMFVIGELRSPRRAWAAIACLNAGTAAAFLAILLQSRLKLAAALLVCVGVGFYLAELKAIVRARRRVALDGGIRLFLVSQSLLVPTAVLGLVLAVPGLQLTEFVGRLETAYGFLAILGVIATAILGMVYKILPFLVWFSAYGRAIGRHRTPALHDMYSAPLQQTGGRAWILALTLGLAGILLASPGISRLAAMLVCLSLVTLAVNTARILGHLIWPRLQPLTPPGKPSSTSPS